MSLVEPLAVRYTATSEPGTMNPLTRAGPGSETLIAMVPAVGIVSAPESPSLPNFVLKICSPG